MLPRLALLTEMGRLARPRGMVAIAIPNLGHALEPTWSRLIHRFTDHDDYDMPEQPLSLDDLTREFEEAGLVPIATECIDAWDTLGHYPSLAPLRAASSFGTRFLPRPPKRIRHRWGTRILVVGRVP